ncbi:MAG: glycosyltransferase, partial [Halobacteriovoraceae bacterium]|nr:glycosyltransferase [Halobacteriovoraceae bacterium]
YHPFSGGMESVVKDLCEGLHDKGHDVTVLCSNTKATYSEEIINGVRVIRAPRTGVLFGQNINPTFFNLLHKLSKEVDLVHVHCPNPQAESFALSLPKTVPIVATYHSDIVRQKTLLKFYKPVFHKFLSRCQKIFVPTQNHINYSSFLPNFTEKCEIIPFGIREDFLKSTEENLNQARDARRNYGPYALFVGRIVGYKGIDVLIDAAKNLDQKVIIVGEGPEKTKLELKVKSMGLSEQVIFLGKVMDSDLFVGLYHGCEMLVLPSITPNENFGVVQLEAMACGKPVVTTNLKSGVPAVGLKGKTCLIVEPGDAHQLASSMTMIFNNKELKQTLGRAGRERFEELYTWKEMINKQITSYRRTCELYEIVSKHGYGKKSA